MSRIAAKAPVDSRLGAPETLRRNRQCIAILKLLLAGHPSNAELAGKALKYTSRISDLRKAGFEVTVASRDYATGVVSYALASRHRVRAMRLTGFLNR